MSHTSKTHFPFISESAHFQDIPVGLICTSFPQFSKSKCDLQAMNLGVIMSPHNPGQSKLCFYLYKPLNCVTTLRVSVLLSHFITATFSIANLPALCSLFSSINLCTKTEIPIQPVTLHYRKLQEHCQSDSCPSWSVPGRSCLYFPT